MAFKSISRGILFDRLITMDLWSQMHVRDDWIHSWSGKNADLLYTKSR